MKNMSKEKEMSTVRKTYVLPTDLTEDMDENIPKGKHSAYVARAVTKSLKEDNREKLIEIIDNFEGMEGTGEDSTEVLRKIRDEN